MILRIVLFLLLNFAALGIGAALMSKGATSLWYQNLNQAPWTPPGWVFGAAWTFIMIAFAIYMSAAWGAVTDRKTLLVLFAVQWILNVLWNPVFFKYHQVLLGLIIITALTLLVGYILFRYFSSVRSYSLLILPYFIWLLIATSLNAYIYLKNPDFEKHSLV